METMTRTNGNYKVIKPIEVDKYEARIYAVDTREEFEMFLNESGVIIYTFRQNFKALHNADSFKYGYTTNEDGEEIEAVQGEDFETDKIRFQKAVDNVEGVGKYKVFALNAYIHSDTAFHINENKDSGWDNGCVGFIALPRVNDNWTSITADNRLEIEKYLTVLMEGSVYEYRIYDNEVDDFVWDDSYMYYSGSGDYTEFREWEKKVEERYGVNFDLAKEYY